MGIKNDFVLSAPVAFDVAGANRAHATASPPDILDFVRASAARPVLTTNFRPLSVALVHLANAHLPGIPVIWIDHGFNTDETRDYVREIAGRLDLNLKIYTPAMHDAADVFAASGIPAADTPEHARFTERVKLEPFARALDDWKPDFWITGIRADQTDFRRSLDVFSPGARGTIRTAPLFRWTEVDIEGYIYEHDLPDYEHYFDPTKAAPDRECGLQAMV